MKTIALFILAFFSISEVQAKAQTNNGQSVPKDYFRHLRGPRGHRGETGPQGEQGPPGEAVPGVYAHAYYKLTAGSSAATFTFGQPIIFNTVGAASGIDTSQITSTGGFVIQESGDYEITFYVYATPSSGASSSVLGLLVNGTASQGSLVYITVGTNAAGTVFVTNATRIMSLNTGDVVKLANLGTSNTNNLVSLDAISPTSNDVTVASMIIKKVS